MAESKMLALFTAARQRSVPILVVRTADQMAAAESIRAAVGDFPVVQWDAARGLTAIPAPDGKLDPKAVLALKNLGVAPVGGADAAVLKAIGDATTQFVDAMQAILKMPRGSVVLAHNAHRQLVSSEPYAVAASVQAVANTRDRLKQDFRMLVLLCPSVQLPVELEQDVVTIDNELPETEELRTIVTELHASAKLPAPSAEVAQRAVDAVSGLSSFAAEQVVAMSLQPSGLDLDALWERKRVMIEQTDGLAVYRGTETLDDLKGLASVKARLRAHKHAKKPVGVVVWIDEGSDVFANVEQDTSGVKTDQQKVLLVEMEQNGWPGMIFVGVPGSGKSAVARAFGNEAGVPEIAIDFGAMESRYVGDSEAKLRQAIQVIKRVGHGRAFFVLTCNSLKGIRPQFMRRFRRGVFFFDLPTAEERAAIWALYRAKYEIPANEPQPDDTGWTGAEIRECCESAWDTSSTLIDAARYIIPVSQSRASEIEEMRKEAHGRFLDASHPGAYHYEPAPMQKMVRAIALPPQAVEAIVGMKES